jgi:hypothetical protein
MSRGLREPINKLKDKEELSKYICLNCLKLS